MTANIETLVKKIHLYIPHNESIQDKIYSLSPEETLILLKTGYESIVSAKNGLQVLTHHELYTKIEEEIGKKYATTIDTLQSQLNALENQSKIKDEIHKHTLSEENDKFEKHVANRLSVQKDTYDSIHESFVKEREHMQKQLTFLKDIEKEINHKAHEEAVRIIHSELENMKAILNEKDKQNEHYKQSFEKAMEKIDVLTQKKSVASIGKIGEHQFKEIATSAFRDFDSFELADVHNIGGQGDFHLKFKEFVVLADSKLYTNKVNSTSRDKIKRDLKKNEHIHFAWLISLDTTIDKFDKAPFMFEWLSDNKCVCYVNSLLKYDEPAEILRSVWYCCKTLYNIMVNEKIESQEINKLREQELKVREIAQKLVKNSRERETIMTQLRTNFDKSDEYIRDILNAETNKVADKYYGIVVQWWNTKLENAPGEKIKSTAIWNQFKRDNDSVGDFDCNSFKDIICSFLTEDKLLKPKTKTGALEVLNYRWKPWTSDTRDKPEKMKIQTLLTNEIAQPDCMVANI